MIHAGHRRRPNRVARLEIHSLLLSFFSVFFFSRLFFIYELINCPGWGKRFHPLCLGTFLISSFYLVVLSFLSLFFFLALVRADHSGGSRLSFNKYIYVFIDFLFYLFIYLRTEKNAHAREQGRLTMIIGRIAIVYTTQRERGKKRGKEMGVNGYHLIVT